MQSSQEANLTDSDQPNPRDLFYQFFGGENDRLVAFLLSRDHSLDREEAQDLVGELLLRLINRIVPLSPIRNLSSYIFRSLSNLLIEKKRQKRHVIALEAGIDTEDEQLSMMSMLESEDSPHLAYEKKELRQHLFKAIDALQPDQRAVVVGNMLMGKTFEELSNEWKTPVGTLLARKHRAIRVLREELKDFDPNR